MIETWSDLAEHLGDQPVAEGLRTVIEIDLAARGPVWPHNIAAYVAVVRRPMRLEYPSAPGYWRYQAACIGRQMCYSAIQSHQNRVSYADRVMEREALECCFTCPVLKECRDWAMQDVEPATDHVAGGLTPRQRHALRKGIVL